MIGGAMASIINGFVGATAQHSDAIAEQLRQKQQIMRWYSLPYAPYSGTSAARCAYCGTRDAARGKCNNCGATV